MSAFQKDYDELKSYAAQLQGEYEAAVFQGNFDEARSLDKALCRCAEGLAELSDLMATETEVKQAVHDFNRGAWNDD